MTLSIATRNRISSVDAEERHRCCWYGRRTPALPDDPGSHTIVDGELVYCAHPMYWPVVRYEFDLSNCEDCDVFKPKRPATTSIIPDK